MKRSQKNKLRKWWRKIRKAAYKAICTFLATLLCIGCGTTKAVVQKPAEGTSTTITITTNNPVTTNVDPNTNVKFK